jgi:DNA ligase-1
MEDLQDMITFECLLASSEIPAIAEVPLPTMMSFKYDGMRGLIINGRAMSRKMLPFPNLFLQKWVAHNAAYLNGFDCEIIVGAPNLPTTFNTTQSAIGTEEGRPDFKLYVLDHWDMEGETAEMRYAHLQTLFENLPPEVMERCVLVEQRVAKIASHVQAYYREAVDKGYEGIMCKHPRKPYKYGRSTLKEAILLKWKEFADSEILIDEVLQGKKNGNEKKKDELGFAKRSSHKAGKTLEPIVGGFCGKDINPNSPFYGQRIKVGPGSFKKDMLRALWAKHVAWLDAGGNLPDSPVKGAKHSPIIGQIMTYKYQVAGVKDKPRFPGAKGFRAKLDT